VDNWILFVLHTTYRPYCVEYFCVCDIHQQLRRQQIDIHVDALLISVPFFGASVIVPSHLVHILPMDRREEYWGHHPIIHDPEEYNSPPTSSYDTFSHHPAHHNIQPGFTPEHTHGLPPPPQQQPQYRFDHRSSRNTAINTDDVLCGRGKTSFNHGTYQKAQLATSIDTPISVSKEN
jgi:hypothetical protein